MATGGPKRQEESMARESDVGVGFVPSGQFSEEIYGNKRGVFRFSGVH